MSHYVSIGSILFSFAAARTLRAATLHAVPASDANRTWTGLIPVVGQPTNRVLQGVSGPAPQSRTKEPASLKVRLEGEQADLRGVTQALDDVRELKGSTGGANLAGDNIGITPEATIDILRSRVREIQRKLDALEDLAGRNGIPPGVWRGPRQGRAAENAVRAAEQSQYDTSAHGDDL